jgi:hypothetical protein
VSDPAPTAVVSELFDRLKFAFRGHGFHTLLWKLIVDDHWKGKEIALIALYDGNVVIAEKGEPGYVPSPAYLAENLGKESRKGVLRVLNEKIFKLSEEDAALIVATTLRGASGKD